MCSKTFDNFRLEPTPIEDMWNQSNGNCIPVGIVVDSSGKVYISHDKWIKIFNADGSLYSEINQTTHPNMFLDNSFLRGIDIDNSTGEIYVIDSSIYKPWNVIIPEPVITPEPVVCLPGQHINSDGMCMYAYLENPNKNNFIA